MRNTLGGRITAMERWLTELRAGRAFFRGTDIGPTAANVSHVQLINPAASGVTALVRALFVSVDTQVMVQFGEFDTALTNDIGAGVNLLATGAAGAAHVRTQDSAGALFTTQGEILLGVATPLQAVPEWHFELAAGRGLAVHPSNTNVRIVATFYWLEL